MSGKSYSDVVKLIQAHKTFGILHHKDPMLRMPSADKTPGAGKFAAKTKTAAIWDAALPGAPKCPYCGGLWHRNSVHGDHIIAKRDGGDNRQSNAAIAHPYCDATYKEARSRASANRLSGEK
jgi:5-methylcytosine-specific restriction endonuclease McrA